MTSAVPPESEALYWLPQARDRAQAIAERDPSTSYCFLLDADADLAEQLDLRMRVAARPVVVAMSFELQCGPVDLSSWLEATVRGFGLLVLDGLLVLETCVAERSTAELVGAGDLLTPPDQESEDFVAPHTSWRAMTPLRLGVLDAAFADRVSPWPELGRAVSRRTDRRLENLSVQRAISCQPRLEVRLSMFLWQLAARWGKVEPGGILLPLPLTHQVLGRLVGAERPSVTHALTRLAAAELVTGHAGEWHLRGTLDHHLTEMVEHGEAHEQRVVTERPQRRAAG
jgi:CRP/FNR family cyclic AMP-dependent transcriptional regulator